MCPRVGRGREGRPDRWEPGLALRPSPPGRPCPCVPSAGCARPSGRRRRAEGRPLGSARQHRDLEKPLISPPSPPGCPFLRAKTPKRSDVGELMVQCCFSFQLRLGRERFPDALAGRLGRKGHPPSPPRRRPPPARGEAPTSLPHCPFPGPGTASLTWTPHLATMSAAGRPTTKWVQGGKGERSETRGRTRPGRTPHYPDPRHSARRPSAHPGSSVPSPVVTAFTWAEGLLGSEREGEVGGGFKGIPRSSCPRRPPGAPDPGTRGGRRPGSKCPPPPGPQALGVAPQQQPWDSETECHQEASSPPRSAPERL